MADWESTGTASLLEEDSETLTALARIEAARRSPPAAARDHSHSPAMAVTSPTRTRLTSFDSIPPTSPLSRPSPYAHAGDECTPVHVAWSAASVADAEPREEQPRSDGAASPCVVQNRDYRDKLEVRVGAENVVVRLPPRSPAPESVRANAAWNAGTARSAGFTQPPAYVFKFINEARVFLKDKFPPSPTSPRPWDGGCSHQRSRSSSPTRGPPSPSPLSEVFAAMRPEGKAKTIPTWLPDDSDGLPDSHHAGNADYYNWRDQKKREIDANREKMVLRSKIVARCEEIRASTPPSLRLNPAAKGIKGPELPPPAPLRYSKWTKPAFIRELEEMALHQAAYTEPSR